MPAAALIFNHKTGCRVQSAASRAGLRGADARSGSPRPVAPGPAERALCAPVEASMWAFCDIVSPFPFGALWVVSNCSVVNRVTENFLVCLCTRVAGPRDLAGMFKHGVRLSPWCSGPGRWADSKLLDGLVPGSGGFLLASGTVCSRSMPGSLPPLVCGDPHVLPSASGQRLASHSRPHLPGRRPPASGTRPPRFALWPLRMGLLGGSGLGSWAGWPCSRWIQVLADPLP